MSAVLVVSPLWGVLQTSVWYVWWFVVVLGLLVFVHEFGHFLLAKAAGVGVLKFSLGFGKRLWGFRRGETDYIVSLVPLGGYVKMVGEDPKEEVEDPEKSFTRKSVAWRAAIIGAGPAANFLLAVVILWGLFVGVGLPVTEPVIGAPAPDSPAQAVGLLPRDRIQAVNGSPVRDWGDLFSSLRRSSGAPLTLTVARQERTLELRVTPVRRTVVVQGLAPQIRRVTEGHAAAAAGLMPGDKILAIEGKPVQVWSDLQDVIYESAGRTLMLRIKREGETVEVPVTPRRSRLPGDPSGREVGLIGVEPIYEVVRTEMPVWDIGITPLFERLNPAAALWEGTRRTVEVSGLVLYSFWMLIRGELALNSLGGPIRIAQEVGQQAQTGLRDLIPLVAFLSITLGVFNLLPIPLLDGGHLFFAAVEAVRGRPVKIKTREIAQQVGLALLVALMVFAFYNDISRLDLLRFLGR